VEELELVWACCAHSNQFLHPLSGAHTTVSTASGICRTVTAICRYRGRVGTGLVVLCTLKPIPPSIIRSAYNCIYSIWYLSHRYCYLPLSWKRWNWDVTVWQIPNAVDTLVCAPDDGWKSRPKYVEQFPDKINCITLHLVGYILEYISFVFYEFIGSFDGAGGGRGSVQHGCYPSSWVCLMRSVRIRPVG
jgi:hypothetical protein